MASGRGANAAGMHLALREASRGITVTFSINANGDVMNQATSSQAIEAVALPPQGAVQLAQAAPTSGAMPMASSAAPALGTLSNATPGVEIVRDGQRIAAQGNVPLQAGDRVLVPDGGQAAVAFAGSSANQAPLSGVLTGGSDAVISSATLPGGMQQVTVDLAAGDLAVAATGPADAASLLVKKPIPAVAGAGVGAFALGALGVGAAAALLNDDDGDDDGEDDDPPVPPPPPPPGAEADKLLDPSKDVLDEALGSLDNSLGLGSALAPVIPITDGATHVVNNVLEPLVGGEFRVDNPNALDPVDGVVASAGGAVAGLLAPVLGQGRSGVMSEGPAGHIVGSVAKQVDYLTDGVVHLVDEVVLGDVVDGLLGGTPVAGLVNGIVGDHGLLGAGSTVDGLTQGLLGAQGPVGGLLGEDGLVGSLLGGGLPGTDLLGGVLGEDGLLGGGLLGGALPGSDLVGGLLGEDGLVGGLLGGGLPGTDLLGGVLGEDGLLGGDLLGGALPGTDLVDGLLGGDGALGGLLGGVPGGGGEAPSGHLLLSPVNALAGAAAATADGLPVAGELAGPLLASAPAPVDATVTLVSGALAPVLGASFTADDPNALDPVDGLAASAVGSVGGLASPLVDGVLGAGATNGLLSPVAHQVDFLTDGVANVLGGDLLGGDLLGGGLPGLDAVGGLLGEDGLLGGGLLSGGLLDGALPGTELVDGLLGDGGLLAGITAPVTSLVPGAGADGGAAPAGGLLQGLLG